MTRVSKVGDWLLAMFAAVLLVVVVVVATAQPSCR